MASPIAHALLGAALAWSVQLHIHGSLSEGTGSMSHQIDQAREHGLDVLWWTDHDYYLQPGGALLVDGFDFDSGGLAVEQAFWPVGSRLSVEWEAIDGDALHPLSSVGGEAAAAGAAGWRLELPSTPFDDAWQSRRWRLGTRPAVNYRPLLGEVRLTFRVRPLYAASPDAELRVCTPLSEVVGGVQNRVCLVHGTLDATLLDDGVDVSLPIDAEPGVFTEISLDLSELARERYPDLGEDQHAEFIDVEVRARSGGRASYDVDEFRFEQDVTGQDLMDAQRAFVAGRTAPEVEQLVGQEVSLTGGGSHLGAFGSDVPVLSYADLGDGGTPEAVAFIHDHGGLVAWNHLFGFNFGLTLNASERAEAVDAATQDLLATSVHGADMLEVGYREREAPLQDFLTVWDSLSVEGVIVTGIGSSDLHAPMEWPSWLNNFVTWVVADAPEEPLLLEGLGKGEAFFGDPHLYEGGDAWLSLGTGDGARMGQVVAGAAGPVDVIVELDPAREGDEVRLVENGAVIQTWGVEAAGAFTGTVPVDPSGTAVVRAEVWTSAGQAALFTNPIYFFDSAPAAVSPGRIF